MWKQSNNITNENMDQNILESNNIRSDFQDFKTETILEEIDEIIQQQSSPSITRPQLKLKSKLPFTTKSYRKNYK